MSRTLNLLRQGAEHKIGLLNIKSIWDHFFFLSLAGILEIHTGLSLLRSTLVAVIKNVAAG